MRRCEFLRSLIAAGAARMASVVGVDHVGILRVIALNNC